MEPGKVSAELADRAIPSLTRRRQRTLKANSGLCRDSRLPDAGGFQEERRSIDRSASRWHAHGFGASGVASRLGWVCRPGCFLSHLRQRSRSAQGLDPTHPMREAISTAPGEAGSFRANQECSTSTPTLLAWASGPADWRASSKACLTRCSASEKCSPEILRKRTPPRHARQCAKCSSLTLFDHTSDAKLRHLNGPRGVRGDRAQAAWRPFGRLGRGAPFPRVG
jgi:hypothetical protein